MPYLTPNRGRVIERHSAQFFYARERPATAQVLAISRGKHSPRAAHITWTGMATYGSSSGPSSVEDMFVTGEADFTRSPLPIRAGRRVFCPADPLIESALPMCRAGIPFFDKHMKAA